MKTKFECEICKTNHDSKYAAERCETTHTIMTPEKMKWYWFIPFIGWFMIPYFLFTKKNAIILWGDSLTGDFIRAWILFGPFIALFILYLIHLII